jgi:nucleoside-diphosphate-sugar epimerase
MTILLTGASGFLGKVLNKTISTTHQVMTLGKAIQNDIICDLSVEIPNLNGVQAVIHAAGKAHTYPKTEAEKQAFFDVNVKGTQHLLEALENQQIRKLVFISTVSVYGLEKGDNIDESTPLHGKTPYALSKIQAEDLITTWCSPKGIPYLILRLPLVVGPNPLGNLAKMIYAIQKGTYVKIAKGNAKKSMVLASDVGTLILHWIQNTAAPSGIYNLTDGHHPTFYELEETLKVRLGKKWIPTMPSFIATILGKIGDHFSFFPVNTATIHKITHTFTFSDAKARKELGWQPKAVLDFYNDL